MSRRGTQNRSDKLSEGEKGRVAAQGHRGEDGAPDMMGCLIIRNLREGAVKVRQTLDCGTFIFPNLLSTFRPSNRNLRSEGGRRRQRASRPRARELLRAFWLKHDRSAPESRLWLQTENIFII